MSFPRIESVKDFPRPCLYEETIGNGNFSTVHRIRGSKIALKAVSKLQVSKLRKGREVIIEKKALLRLGSHHRNIVSFISTWSDSEFCFIATGLCSKGELWEMCRRCGEPERRAKFFFRKIMDGLSFVHRMGIIHRDLKAENIFITADMVVKIGDFGSSFDIFNANISCSGEETSFEHYVGTPNFIAPEALENKENDELSDIWSLGCLFYQVLVGIAPFAAGSEYLVFVRMRAGDLKFPPRGLTNNAIDLVRMIVQHDRALRPSIDEIACHPFFREAPDTLLPYTSTDDEIKRISREDSIEINDELILHFHDEIDRDRLRLISTVREWEKQSQPGSGTASFDHLDEHNNPTKLSSQLL